ncbi:MULTISPECIES: SycD/LcrH family type III secretion system chaperone [unclassified Bordetella]|uniref:SycD/LcrH family type III secretion system chaperone n=1 Tax=unclassified Bordetella TaxID=2630031 RepID=UPI0013274F7E|nr:MULTISPECIES: SycD/LcrH family type III secretion system chaperone [unclassified Bordetella]MVW70486.1 CesD/SycD/LcrH family type III secretion system chaperone [Bordetella sp. 15P40C-2]MVW78575.1 CesD/SycD/LcrH family type III secretion system chaperone [Bordetella sp. 02P26C-1]
MSDTSMHSVDDEVADLGQSVVKLLRSGAAFTSESQAEENEAIYAVGHGMYEQGRYVEAFKVFSLLVIRNHLEPRYLFALGGACQMLGKYTEALQHYMAAAMGLDDDPLPIFHAAQCLIATSHVDEARESLELVLDICPEHQTSLRNRAQMLLDELQNTGAAEGATHEHH